MTAPHPFCQTGAPETPQERYRREILADPFFQSVPYIVAGIAPDRSKEMLPTGNPWVATDSYFPNVMPGRMHLAVGADAAPPGMTHAGGSAGAAAPAKHDGVPSWVLFAAGAVAGWFVANMQLDKGR